MALDERLLKFEVIDTELELSTCLMEDGGTIEFTERIPKPGFPIDDRFEVLQVDGEPALVWKNTGILWRNSEGEWSEFSLPVGMNIVDYQHFDAAKWMLHIRLGHEVDTGHPIVSSAILDFEQERLLFFPDICQMTRVVEHQKLKAGYSGTDWMMMTMGHTLHPINRLD